MAPDPKPSAPTLAASVAATHPGPPRDIVAPGRVGPGFKVVRSAPTITAATPVAGRVAAVHLDEWTSRTICFTHNTGPGPSDTQIFDKTAEIIRQTSKGAEICIAIAGWTGTGLARGDVGKKIWGAVKHAVEENNATVWLVSRVYGAVGGDHEWQGVNPKEFRTEVAGLLNKDAKRVRWLNEGEDALNTNNMHNKFVLISAVDGGLNGTANACGVVIQSSANWRDTDAGRANDMIAVADWDLYTGYRHYFRALFQAASGESTTSGYPDTGMALGGKVIAHYLPYQQRGAEDPMIKLLQNVVPSPYAKVRIAASHWHRRRSTSRGQRILDELFRLKNEGVDVRVLIDPDDTKDSIQDQLADPTNPRLPWAEVNSHTKFALVNAPLVDRGGDDFHRVVITGSQNYSSPHAKSRGGMMENMLVFTDDDLVYDAYLDYWLWMCDQADQRDPPAAG